MKKIILMLSLLICSTLFYQHSKAQCHIDDWTALKALYENTNGENWKNNKGWEQIEGTVPQNKCDLGVLHGVTLKVSLDSFENGRVDLVRLVNNKLNGEIPNEIHLLNYLTKLDLSNNQLSGNLTAELGRINRLTILDLSNNKLKGNIPDEFGDLTNLLALNLSHNQLNGSIPIQLKNLTNLSVLNLSYNQFTGSIPNELGLLTNLSDLNLSYNQLSGNIPVQFENLTNLSVLNLSYNQLTGNIPALSLNSFKVNGNYFKTNNISNASNFDQFIFNPQYVKLSNNSNIITINSLNEPVTEALTVSVENENIIKYQWCKNNEVMRGDVDTSTNTLNLHINEPENAGAYTLKLSEILNNTDTLEYIYEPFYVVIDGYDLYGEAVVSNQVMIEFCNAQERQVYEDSIIVNYGGFVIDSCNCNREIYLYEFPNANNAAEIFLNEKSIAMKDSTEIDSDFNNILKFGPINIGPEAYEVSNVSNESCEDTISIYMLDTGFTGDSPFLQAAVVEACDGMNDDILDNGWHGTFGFNSITHHLDNNVPLKIVPVKIFTEDDKSTLFNLVCGLYFAIDNNADVINLSGGFYGGEVSAILENAVSTACSKGIFIATSAGNDTIDIDIKHQYPAYFAKDYPNVISVASITESGDLSEFSNRSRNAVKLAAFGENIVSNVPKGTMVASGTSMSTFFVSKELALEIGTCTNRTFEEILTDFETNRLVSNERHKPIHLLKPRYNKSTPPKSHRRLPILPTKQQPKIPNPRQPNISNRLQFPQQSPARHLH